MTPITSKYITHRCELYPWTNKGVIPWTKKDIIMIMFKIIIYIISFYFAFVDYIK